MRRIMSTDEHSMNWTAFRSKNDCFALVTFKNVKHHSLSLCKVIDSLYFNSSRPPEAGGRRDVFFVVLDSRQAPLDTGFSPVGYPGLLSSFELWTYIQKFPGKILKLEFFIPLGTWWGHDCKESYETLESSWASLEDEGFSNPFVTKSQSLRGRRKKGRGESR